MATFTAVYIEVEDGWIVGCVEEIAGVHTQGRTIEETRQRLRAILAMTLELNREYARKAFAGYRIILRERIPPR